ncbi:unnamed protein product [Cylindrotheca closterium]|uniref:Uncharacterized protein n=1 Tax=Cylindrotheca closterium TaxID=2856 RepID=A0AAD2FSU6_9STRA|nr:unnamed protein product [Cylindrotheca closterium]CAJ1963082.1 unnamed protein product [Cylindrotheca closterium]
MDKVGEREEKEFLKEFRSFANKHKASIADLVMNQSDGATITSILYQMEAASGAELMCAGAASDRVRTLQEDFRREDIAKGIIKKWEPDTAKYTKFIGNNSAIVSVVRKAKQLLCWLCYLYQNIRGGEFVTTEASIPTDP